VAGGTEAAAPIMVSSESHHALEKHGSSLNGNSEYQNQLSEGYMVTESYEGINLLDPVMHVMLRHSFNHHPQQHVTNDVFVELMPYVPGYRYRILMMLGLEFGIPDG